MSIIYGILSFFTGTILTLQSGINGQLRGKVGDNPILASLISFTCGMLTLAVLLLITAKAGLLPLPAADVFTKTEWWMWASGLIGAGLVLSAIVLPAKIGFASYFSMLVAGQLAGSVFADAIGLFGSEIHPLNPGRALGIFLLFAGALLIQKKKEPGGKDD